jgi:hypothetical protein
VAVAEEKPKKVRSRGAQEIVRQQSRRRRPNIEGAKKLVQVVLSEAEYAAVKEAADEIPSTVPWFLVESALPGAGGEGALVPAAPRQAEGPWLPWKQRQALAGALMSATRALHEVRLTELSHVGANLNQLARFANANGVVDGEDLGEVLADLTELIADLSKRAEEIEGLARQAVRR